jgi:NAD(P)-dependent dehydrogenase (short-subunit alcohol dehydrogenase family)
MASSKAKQSAGLDRLYETVAKVTGRVDVVFANAGVGEFAPLGRH